MRKHVLEFTIKVQKCHLATATFQTLRALSTDSVHLTQSYETTTRMKATFKHSKPYEFLLLILSNSEGRKTDSTMATPLGFGNGTPELVIQCPED